MHKNKLLVIALLMLGISTANGAEFKDPLAKLFTGHFEPQLKARINVASDPEIIKAQATYFKRFYDALIAEGFTKEQALELVKSSLSSKVVYFDKS